MCRTNMKELHIYQEICWDQQQRDNSKDSIYTDKIAQLNEIPKILDMPGTGWCMETKFQQ